MTTSKSEEMNGILVGAMECLNHADQVPKARFRDCSGLLLMNAVEVGIGISAQHATGVLLAFYDGKWSPPVAMSMTGVGAGSLGYAEKRTIIVLNGSDVRSVLGGGGTVKFGTDANLTNYIGGEVGADVGVNTKGAGTSFAYSYSEGGIISLEISSCVVKPMDKINQEVYGKPASEVIAGGAEAPKGSKEAELMEKVAELGQKAQEELAKK